MRKARKQKDQPSQTGRKRDRRPEIVLALYRTLLSKGFAGTSLTDLAKGAGISLSHLLYYFSTKEEVLAALAFEVIEHQWESMEAHRNESPVDQFQALADHNFGGPGGVPAFRTIVMELMAVANHDKRLREMSRKNARVYYDHMREVFRNTPTAPGLNADDAALIAGALWLGLYFNSHYLTELNRKRSHKLFLNTLLMLADLTRPQPQAVSPVVRRPQSKHSGLRRAAPSFNSRLRLGG